ncbi:hypothetical protein [Arcticibacterium luteifluviistationis]|uniref:Bacterial surface antigen (D15) domain-containing protein n=1 Tax=Arcticibacterium luteifluviistationis TaxID=1784714 RepID=A0A2Z4G921_9BACT|nr:hypothetical protein [Arcticibacterium luteifluviistationis]AWV97691.1 hypothetical protein DJ013_05730 [Arcticibacterium luteifluviistationis]
MKIKLLFLFFLISISSFSQNGLQQKYDRATFTVVPIMTELVDTLVQDTIYSNWSSLPYYSVFLSQSKQKLLQTELTTGAKFYYNPTSILHAGDLVVGKSDTSVFEHLYGLQSLVSDSSKNYVKRGTKPKHKSIPTYSTDPDIYATWIKKKLENSTIPGEMMMMWTNQDTLMQRSQGNIDFGDRDRKADLYSFNYFKKLLEKNYIVVENIVSTKKYIINPEILKAEREAKKNTVTSSKGKGILANIKEIAKDVKELKGKDSTTLESQYHNPYLSSNGLYNPTRILKKEQKFSKAHVFRIILDEKLLSDLSAYPPIFPEEVNLELVCSIKSSEMGSSTTNFDGSPVDKEEGGIAAQVMQTLNNISGSGSTLSPEYIEKKEEAQFLFLSGEYPCAKSTFENLKLFKDSEKELLDSMISNCELAIVKYPAYNPIAYQAAAKFKEVESTNYPYSTNCSSIARKASSSEKKPFQIKFESVISELEEKLPEFQILTSVVEAKGNKIKANIDLSQGIYLDQQYKIIERSINKAGQRYDNRVGTARVIKVSTNLYASDTSLNQTIFAQIDGKKIPQNALLVQNDISGFSLYLGYGRRYDNNAVILSADYSIKSIEKHPIIKIGLGFVYNTQKVDNYNPIYFNLNASREFYFSRFFDFKPYVEIGYGGDFKNDTPLKRNPFVGVGFGLPLNTFNRKSTKKIKLMPEVSISTLGFKPQYSLQTKFEF